MNRVNFFFLMLLVAVTTSCSENDTPSMESRTIVGSFSSNEVKINTVESNTIALPDFPYEEVLVKDSYTMAATNNSETELNSWTQDLTDSFSFNASGDVTFTVNHPTNYRIPVAQYYLTGQSTVIYPNTSVTIQMNNTEYAAIAVYSPHVQSVELEGVKDLPIVTNGNEGYIYSFVEPNNDYALVIKDDQGNTHNVMIPANQLDANSNVRLYLLQSDIGGDFELIINWNVINQPINPMN